MWLALCAGVGVEKSCHNITFVFFFCIIAIRTRLNEGDRRYLVHKVCIFVVNMVYLSHLKNLFIMKISHSSVMFRGFLSVLLFVLCLPLLWAQPWTEPPVVTRITPLMAEVGDEITIHGERMNVDNSDFSRSRMHISFGGSNIQKTRSVLDENAIPLNTRHRITVPSDATSGPITIRYADNEVVHDNTDSDPANDKDLNRDGKKDVYDHFILVSVTGTEPEEIARGQMVTLRGSGFAANPKVRPGITGSLFVFFNIDVASASNCELFPATGCDAQTSLTTDGTSVTFTVPDCANPGAGVIRVFSPDVSGITAGVFPGCINIGRTFRFTGADPEFTSFSPASARVGTEVTISGMNLSATAADNEVAFGTNSFSSARSVEDLGSGAFSLKVIVPADAVNGKIKLRVGGVTVESPTDFTRISHTVTNFRPTTAVTGQMITIEGTNFAEGELNEVYFVSGSTRERVNAASNEDGTEIYPTVPEDAPSSGSIEVNIGHVSQPLSGMYTVRDLPSFSFTDFEPKNVGLGDTITLHVRGFHPNYGRSRQTVSWGHRIHNQAAFIDVNDDLTRARVRVGEEILGAESTLTEVIIHRCNNPPFCSSVEDRTTVYRLGDLVVEETQRLALHPSSPLLPAEEKRSRLEAPASLSTQDITSYTSLSEAMTTILASVY